MGIGLYRLPPELIDLFGPLVFVAMASLAVRQTFGAEHGPHPAFLIQLRVRWKTYSARARKNIGAGAAILLFGVLALAVEVVQADGAGPDDFIGVFALGIGVSQLLYGVLRAWRPVPSVNGEEANQERADSHKRRQK